MEKRASGERIIFYVTYLAAEDGRTIDEALDFWCNERNIPCGVGNTISKAYEDFKEQLKVLPIK